MSTENIETESFAEFEFGDEEEEESEAELQSENEEAEILKNDTANERRLKRKEKLDQGTNKPEEDEEDENSDEEEKIYNYWDIYDEIEAEEGVETDKSKEETEEGKDLAEEKGESLTKEEVEKKTSKTRKGRSEQDEIFNLIMQQASRGSTKLVEEDSINILFMQEPSTTDLVEESPAIHLNSIQGVHGLNLTEETIDYFVLRDLNNRPNKMGRISLKKIKLHIYNFDDKSEFFQFKNDLKHYADLTFLIGIDTLNQTGSQFFFCSTIDARNTVLNSSKMTVKKKKKGFDMKKREAEVWAEMASIKPKKWHSLGSEKEVEDESVRRSRPYAKIEAHKAVEHFKRNYKFSESSWEGNPNAFVGFESQDPSLYPSITSLELDKCVQVTSPKINSSSQTFFAYKRNKGIQHEIQSVSEEEIKKIEESGSLNEFFKKVMGKMERALQQNEMVNVTEDDFQNLKATGSHEVEFNYESNVLQEYITLSEMKHTKDRLVTCLVFHPTLEDIIIMSVAEDVTFDKRIDFHPKMLVEPNFVLFWDLKDPGAPILMLDAPSDVFSFMVNPSDPSIICGGCANGQVTLWDIGVIYKELKSKMQERKRKSLLAIRKRPSFLDKLKDNSEKFVSPLLSPVGLSNLDQSHYKVVTSVSWLPSHIELGRSGAMFENTEGGKSFQFFSIAGDGSIRLWDIRSPKGKGDYQEENLDVIREKIWIHLENNAWKYAARYNFNDENGKMYATLMSLSEESKRSKYAKKFHKGSMSSARSHHSSTSYFSKSSKMSGNDDGDDEDDDDYSKREQGKLIQYEKGLTTIFVGSETGQVALIDWYKNKDGSINTETGTKNCQNIFMQTIHDGAITSIVRSPFHKSLILVVGGGTISIWRESSEYPILATHGSQYFPWCATWSNTRPSVFFIGTQEGVVQVWDLSEKSHQAVLNQQITNGRITCCSVPKTPFAKKHFLSLADSLGNLYVMIIPKYYSKPLPHENSMLIELMQREEKRMATWIKNVEDRKNINHKIFCWKGSSLSAGFYESKKEEIEAEERLSKEYEVFMEYQMKVVTILKTNEPSLPLEESEKEEELDRIIEEAERAEIAEYELLQEDE